MNPRELFAHRVYNIHEPSTNDRRENIAQSLVAGQFIRAFGGLSPGLKRNYTRRRKWCECGD